MWCPSSHFGDIKITVSIAIYKHLNDFVLPQASLRGIEIIVSLIIYKHLSKFVVPPGLTAEISKSEFLLLFTSI